VIVSALGFFSRCLCSRKQLMIRKKPRAPHRFYQGDLHTLHRSPWSVLSHSVEIRASGLSLNTMNHSKGRSFRLKNANFK
jgi:hypothetical protein